LKSSGADAKPLFTVSQSSRRVVSRLSSRGVSGDCFAAPSGAASGPGNTAVGIGAVRGVGSGGPVGGGAGGGTGDALDDLKAACATPVCAAVSAFSGWNGSDQVWGSGPAIGEVAVGALDAGGDDDGRVGALAGGDDDGRLAASERAIGEAAMLSGAETSGRPASRLFSTVTGGVSGSRVAGAERLRGDGGSSGRARSAPGVTGARVVAAYVCEGIADTAPLRIATTGSGRS
jgi:hypothetical protein